MIYLVLSAGTDAHAVNRDQPLDCSNYTAQKIGLERYARLKEFNERYRMKIYLYRVKPQQSTVIRRGDYSYELAYRDIALAVHTDDPAMHSLIQKRIAYFGADTERLISSALCLDQDPDDIYAYSPLYIMQYFPPMIYTFIAEFYVQLGSEVEIGGVAAKDDGSLADVSIEATSDFEAAPDNTETDNNHKEASLRLYSWVDHFRLKEFVEAERILVVEKSECGEEGNFFVASTGHLLGEPAGGGSMTVMRTEMYAVNNYPGVSGEPATRHVVENSVDPTHYWCIPKREFCFKQVEFGKFGVTVHKDQSDTVSLDRVYNLRLGIVSALQQAVIDFCFGRDKNS